ncbi:MAG: hypothetical protein AB2L11_13685 [Syntrophobacteraceae bacterium]
MFIITREKVDLIKERLCDPLKTGECLEDVRKMLEIKEASLWRASVGPCCVEPGLATCLSTEVQLLEAVVKAILEGDTSSASSLLGEFASGIIPVPDLSSWEKML